MDDILQSATLGVVLGIGIILVLRKYPGEPFDFSTIDDNDRPVETSTELSTAIESKGESTASDIIKNMDEDKFVKNSSKLQKLLGVDESTVRDAVRMTKREVSQNSAQINEPVNFVTVAEWALFLLVIVLSWYAMNYTANGDIAAMIRGLFKSEFQTIEKLGKNI